MKTSTIITRLLSTFLVIFLVSCSKNNDKTNGQVLISTIQPIIEINTGDTLKVNLGNFGDEEGAFIYKNPINAKVSMVYRELASSSILYEYFPLDNFIGTDVVTLILNKASDGASSGINDTIKISIIVRK